MAESQRWASPGTHGRCPCPFLCGAEVLPCLHCDGWQLATLCIDNSSCAVEFVHPANNTVHETRSLAIAKRPWDCCIILKSGSYTKAIVLIGLFQSNRDHRLTLRRVIIEKWMYIAQVPINNAPVLGNLCEYPHK